MPRIKTYGGTGSRSAAIRFEWHGDDILKKWRSGANSGIFLACRYLQRKIKAAMKEWGSIPISGNLRRRIVHSNPGQPPLRQTDEYRKSIQISTNRAKQLGIVYSDDPKASTLELGGSFRGDQNKNKHSNIRLVNPIKKLLNIAARPVFGPIFKQEYRKMVDIIHEQMKR